MKEQDEQLKQESFNNNNNKLKPKQRTSCPIDMGRNSPRPKIKIKNNNIVTKNKTTHWNLQTTYASFFLLKAVSSTLVTATAHDVRKQRIRSIVPQLGKNSLNHSL